jgi:CheY-like chemotaxis protein
MSKKKILIVEDQKINRFLIVQMLKDVYDLSEACNGEEAVEMVEQHPNEFDLILMDKAMPIMGGIEATKIIKEKYPDQLIVSLTAHDYSDEDSIFDSYIRKPVSSAILKIKIEELLK